MVKVYIIMSVCIYIGIVSELSIEIMNLCLVNRSYNSVKSIDLVLKNCVI